MSHAFLSYVRDDKILVERIAEQLIQNNIPIWLDKNDISPGRRWKSAIQDAIRSGDFFIACFSRKYTERKSTYMNEELLLAIEELRKLPYDKSWFIPLRLDLCEIPRFPIGIGQDLSDIQYIDFVGHSDFETGVHKLLRAINPLIATDEKWHRLVKSKFASGIRGNCSLCPETYSLEKFEICPACGNMYCYRCCWKLRNFEEIVNGSPIRKWQCKCGGFTRLIDDKLYLRYANTHDHGSIDRVYFKKSIITTSDAGRTTKKITKIRITGNPNGRSNRMLVIAQDKKILSMADNPHFTIESANKGDEGIELAKLYDFDIILVELSLRNGDGCEIVRRLRKKMINVPIVMFSDLNNIDEKVRGLKAGADEWLTIPCDRDAFFDFVDRVLRRSKRGVIINMDGLSINLENRSVEVNEIPIYMTPTEYALLELLALRKGKIVRKTECLDHLYGGIDEPQSSIIDVLVCKIRKKIATAGGGRNYIRTAIGRGYGLDVAD